VSDNIQSSLRTEQKQKMFNELLRKLRKDTEIEINTEVLEEQNNGGKNDV